MQPFDTQRRWWGSLGAGQAPAHQGPQPGAPLGVRAQLTKPSPPARRQHQQGADSAQQQPLGPRRHACTCVINITHPPITTMTDMVSGSSTTRQLHTDTEQQPITALTINTSKQFSIRAPGVQPPSVALDTLAAGTVQLTSHDRSVACAQQQTHNRNTHTTHTHKHRPPPPRMPAVINKLPTRQQCARLGMTQYPATRNHLVLQLIPQHQAGAASPSSPEPPLGMAMQPPPCNCYNHHCGLTTQRQHKAKLS